MRPYPSCTSSTKYQQGQSHYLQNKHLINLQSSIFSLEFFQLYAPRQFDLGTLSRNKFIFRSHEVLKTSNLILQKSVYLVPIYFEYGIQDPRFLQILINVFSDQYYFKTNNQLIYSVYPYSYFAQPDSEHKVNKFEIGENVDILKSTNLYEKFTWSQGKITQIYQNQVQIAYLYDKSDKRIKIKKESFQIAPLNSKSYVFEWRKNLKKGDLVDIQDSFGVWYNATVLDVIEKQNGKKNIKVTLKVYHDQGNRQDQNGKYFGFAQYEQTLDFTHPKLAPFCSVSKEYCYESSKVSNYEAVEDSNDYQFLEWNGSKIYALPRRKHLSEFHFETINGFGQLGGFDKFIQYLEKQVNFDVLYYFVNAASGVSPYLHRKLAKQLVEKIKQLFEKYLFENIQKTSKKFTKQFSQMIFLGIKTLQKRIYSNQQVTKYQVSLKMKLVDIWLQSEAIKNKLQGLNQLKDIVKNVTYSNQKLSYIKQWVKENKIFQKVYLTNSHVQLIKKSEDFFKYLIIQNILEVTDLEKLYKMAQKSDFESRVTLYKLFQQVSHIFKRDHVLFLIDTILQSQLNLVLNQDIDLLHELSRFSNQFPRQKVVKFFENIILSDNIIKELNDYAIKKYSQMVSKGLQLKSHRRKIIKNFIEKLETHDPSRVTKILKGILQGIGGIGEWSKRQLYDIVSQQTIDQKLVEVLTKSKTKNQVQFNKLCSTILDLLLFMYKITSKIKISSILVIQIWGLIEGNEEKQKQFYKWANQICKCQQGLQTSEFSDLQQFCKKLFTSSKIPTMQTVQFQLAKSIFLQVNKKAKTLIPVINFKQKDQYKRKVQFSQLKLINLIIEMMYGVKSQQLSQKIFSFVIQLYTSKDNSQNQINSFFDRLIAEFKERYASEEYGLLAKTLKLILIVILDSEKNSESKIKSLIRKKYPEITRFVILNEISFGVSETIKKIDMYLPSTMTVMQLRMHVAKEFGLGWKQVKIISNRQLQQYQNSRTLKQLNLNPSQPLSISKRIVNDTFEQELIINNKMNPKATRCWRIIFQKFSTEGKMSKQQCVSFISACLGSSASLKYSNQKTSYLFGMYDDDKDGLITFQNFHAFYEDSAKDKQTTVWSNLRSFGVRSDLTFSYDQVEAEDISNFPRKTITEYPNIYQILFNLLHKREAAEAAFELLLHLPVSEQLEKQILSGNSKQSQQQIFKTEDLYELYYKLNIVEYLARSTELTSEAQKNWHLNFISNQGYERLFSCLQSVNNMEGFMKEKGMEEYLNVVRQIQKTCYVLLNEYWIQCFFKDKIKLRTSQALINYQQEMEDKMDYFVFGRFFKNNKKVEPVPCKLPSGLEKVTWQGKQRNQIKIFLLQQLQTKWSQLNKIQNQQKNEIRKLNLSCVIEKIMDSINIIFMDENPLQFAHLISNILDSVPNSELIKKLYCIILAQCFCSAEEKYHSFYIHQLFKCLTKSSITSTHFRVLALLVSRFGISKFQQNRQSEQNQSQQMVKKFKKVLLDHVLNNSNELTVQGCAKLLTNFNLQGTTYEIFQKIWSQKIFSSSTVCQKDQTKVAIFDLILKFCENNIDLTDKIIKKIVNSLEYQIKNMKIIYCNEFKQRSSTGYAGLKNLGNTCYINSMMQQLFINKNFRYCLLRANDYLQPKIIEVTDKNQSRLVDDNFLHQCQRIFAYLEKSTRMDFVSKDFCVAYKPFGESVNVMIQQDVQEFISMFFDRLESGLSKTVFKKLVDQFYTGKSVNLFKCHSCSETKKVQESFYSISLEVKTSKTLADSFNRFCHGQMISDFKCEFCDKKVDVTKLTRISRAPKTLIIHLQRIVFNLDTFINQKISSKHSFPHNFNLHQSTLDYYQKKQASQGEIEELKEYNYQLIGIICHSGNAQSGHYISYIKVEQNKWIQFNDSLVSSFNPANIQTECFGGISVSTGFDDDFYDDKRENSKSAYILLYQKQGADTIQLILNQQLKGQSSKEKEIIKNKLLQSLDLTQVIEKIAKTQQNNSQVQVPQYQDTKKENLNEQQQENGSSLEDSQKQVKKLLQEKQLQIKRLKSQDNIDVITQSEQKPQMKENQCKTQQMTVLIKSPVSAYIPQNLKMEVVEDNQIHFLQKCLSAPSFVKFFSSLVSKGHNLNTEILPLCQNLTFGFWLKSPSFKDLLNMIDGLLKKNPEGFEEVVTNNPNLINLLIQSSDSQIRSSVALFLAKVIADAVQAKNIDIYSSPDDPIFKFLDKLFSLLPTTVSKCWTKFSQYFQFWYQISCKGAALVEYMVSRQIVKHFMDYFLDTKSPLKIYASKRQHQIGSSYATPSFSMLLKCVFSLLQQRLILKQNSKISQFSLISDPEQQKLLISFESLQKLISENYENIAVQLVKQICPHNLAASEKAAIVILKGICKSNIDNIQPYLEVLHEFVLIQDDFQDLRIKWVIGKQTIAISTISMKIIAMNSYSLDERLHNFESAIYLENGSTLLEQILTYSKKIETLAMLCTKELLRLCQISKKIRDFTFNLESPTLQLSSYSDFFKPFIDKYYEDYKKSYGFYSSSTGFNRQQFAKEVKSLYQNVFKIVSEEKAQKSTEQVQNINVVSQKQEQNKKVKEEPTEKKETEKKEEDSKKNQTSEKQTMIELKSFNQGKKNLVKFSTKTKTTTQNPIIDEDLYNEGDEWEYYDEYEVAGGNTKKYKPKEAVHFDAQNEKAEEEDYYINYYTKKSSNSSSKSPEKGYDEQEDGEPLMKTKNYNRELKQNKDYKQTWHPIKFEYKPIKQLELTDKISKSIKIEQHESIITYGITRPTGYSNKSFPSTGRTQKVSERMLPEVLQNPKIVTVRGFFIKNTSKQCIRIQTNEGCSYCRSGDGLYIWADAIIRIWQSQRTIDWPKWKLYPQPNS